MGEAVAAVTQGVGVTAGRLAETGVAEGRLCHIVMKMQARIIAQEAKVIHPCFFESFTRFPPSEFYQYRCMIT